MKKFVNFEFSIYDSNETRAPIANPPNSAQLEDTPTIPQPQVTSGSVQECREWNAARDRQLQADTQTAVTNIHFASAKPQAKCNDNRLTQYQSVTDISIALCISLPC